MKKLFLFVAPKREKSVEDYELSLLMDISEKFDLGDIKEYGRWSEGRVNYVHARFQNGYVKVKYIEGKESVAVVKLKKKFLNENEKFG